ncbi:uncharacterized protein LOC110443037 [Mizuhopecten yessoensis]|uniref:uncharacterized protein LOC110443037 n=1 Tax=Mizuhopecten yessoensis TaxID=6573 RepID=UPI000B4595D6|nr:uncharacterized protein LOC110443037 [Mizuhopecten yessoensis]
MEDIVVTLGMVGTLFGDFEEPLATDVNDGDNAELIAITAVCAAVNRDDRKKVEKYVQDVVHNYLPDDFKRCFRLSQETFEILLHHLATIPELARRQTKAGRPQISLERELLMTLWFLGTQETVKSICDRFDVQESTFI